VTQISSAARPRNTRSNQHTVFIVYFSSRLQLLALELQSNVCCWDFRSHGHAHTALLQCLPQMPVTEPARICGSANMSTCRVQQACMQYRSRDPAALHNTTAVPQHPATALQQQAICALLGRSHATSPLLAISIASALPTCCAANSTASQF
jgi:hypothetical protein